MHEQIIFLYLKQLPEEHGRSGSIPACKIDAVCIGSTARSPSSDTSCCCRQICTEKKKKKSGGRMHKRQRSAYWVWKDTQIQRERERSTGESLSFCGNQAEADKIAFLFSSLFIFLLCICPSVFADSVFLVLINLSFQKCFVIAFRRLVLSFRCPDFLCQLPAGVQSHMSA